MNKLFGTRTYLVGAMDRVADGGTGWRDNLIPNLHKLGVMVYNPCNKPISNPRVKENVETRNRINELKSQCDPRGRWWDCLDQMREEYGSIRTSDLRMVDTADFLIANIDIDIHACGTYEEIVTANRQKKPILIHCEQGVKHLPNWLIFMLPSWSFFHDWNEIIDYLEDINKGNLPGGDRWVFFDMREEIECIHRERIERLC